MSRNAILANPEHYFSKFFGEHTLGLPSRLKFFPQCCVATKFFCVDKKQQKILDRTLNLVLIMVRMILVNMKNFNLNIFPDKNLYPYLHFHGFEAKQKIIVCTIFQDVSFQKQLQQLCMVNQFC